MKISSATQVRILVLVLLCVGIGAAAYKHFALGFPLLASEQETLWQVEARITFEAEPEQSVIVRLNLPENNPAYLVGDVDNVAYNYRFYIHDEYGVNLAQWQKDKAQGEQVIYLRTQALKAEPGTYPVPKVQPLEGDMSESLNRMASALLEEAPISQNVDGALAVLKRLNKPSDSRAEALLKGHRSTEKRVYRSGQVLALAGFKVQPVSGILLDDEIRSQSIAYFLELSVEGKRWLLDVREIEVVPWQEALLLQRGDEPLLEVFGGHDSEVSFATTETQQAAFTSAVKNASSAGNPLIDFSIYSLPLSEQNAFKLLLVIPLGALVVVILRNIVGLRTSGTFMPVLIALTFLQTSLFIGLLLFVVVVGVGLIMRSYLSHLNLLLVPRIASVLVFVIIIYGAIGILSAKLGWQDGLKVTFFPMIILSWTIERMSILWDEEGPRDVMIEGSGSLLTASIAFVLMSNTFISDTIFLYPELLLVVLAVIISIGSYSGYRLSDLRRFKPMERHH